MSSAYAYIYVVPTYSLLSHKPKEKWCIATTMYIAICENQMPKDIIIERTLLSDDMENKQITYTCNNQRTNKDTVRYITIL